VTGNPLTQLLTTNIIMKTKFTVFAFALSAIGFTSCSGPVGPNTRTGAATGALGGAALGGIIGHQSGRAWEGAAVGAAGGAVVGGVAGNSADQRR